MRIYVTNRAKQFVKKTLIVLLAILLFLIFFSYRVSFLSPVFNSDQEVSSFVEKIFQNRNKAILNGNLELIKDMYDTSTRYGKWAYQYEKRKVKYINNWEKKQGANFIAIMPEVLVKRIKKYKNKCTVILQCITKYKYIYKNNPNDINTSQIGTSHVLDLVRKGENWVIRKEWYKDPFAGILNLDNLEVDKIKEYIISQGPRDFVEISERRMNAVKYADKYNGASNAEKYAFRYNNKYRNYNRKGGDCANFASQVLYEGGNFKKTSAWNYSRGEGTRAWVNAESFTRYMLNSGRASLIDRGRYEDVYKQSYKLLPGDFVAYQEKGDIVHVSVVTDADSKGYSLVSCHNTDRNKVPWDLGWGNKNIKFWLVRVHY